MVIATMSNLALAWPKNEPSGPKEEITVYKISARYAGGANTTVVKTAWYYPEENLIWIEGEKFAWPCFTNRAYMQEKDDRGPYMYYFSDSKDEYYYTNLTKDR